MLDTTTPGAQATDAPAVPHPIRAVEQTTCCIVGAGPAGAILALLLARRNIPVTLLEAHSDLDRDFRGDTVHPAIMEILAEIGLADRALELPHSKIRQARPPGAGFEVNFSRLKTHFPFITMLPQARFLEFLTAEAAHYPAFQLVLRANVRELVEQDGVVRGVRYQGQDGWYEVRALLTVGADGRFSRLRRLAALPPPVTTAQPIDILWFRLTRRPDDPPGVQGNFGPGAGLIMLDRGAQWQIGFILPKGGYQQLHTAGLAAFRQRLVALGPALADRVAELTDWNQCALLSVASDCMPRWYRPGLLLIGDAAHIMSPLGGNGINYAVQDAVAAFNRLAGPLQAGHVTIRDLRAVQRRRAWPTRMTQAVVNQVQERVLTPALTSRQPFSFPTLGRLLLRTPVLRDLPLRWMAFGLWPVHVNPALRAASAPPK